MSFLALFILLLLLGIALIVIGRFLDNDVVKVVLIILGVIVSIFSAYGIFTYFLK